MNFEQLKSIVPTASDAWALAMLEAMHAGGIVGWKRESRFIANASHESRGLTVFEESLYYTNEDSLRRLFKTWDVLDIDDAWGYLRQPERLANRIYANREGNGDVSSGDGWRYRGRGPFQLTFLNNYAAFKRDTGIDVVANPEWLLIPKVGAQSAVWYWNSRNLSDLADAGKDRDLVRLINTGLAGYDERMRIADEAMRVLA